MKSKEEYLEEYRKEHGTKTYMAFQIIFQLIGGIIMIISTINLVNGRKSERDTFIILLIVGIFLFLIGFIFLKVFQNQETKALISWERYSTKSSEEKIIDKRTKTISENEWKCSSCGRINQNYVGTCGCGQRKPE